MHRLQERILQKLTLKPALRFSELKPNGIESNQFMYHLHRVVKDELVRKSENLYKLTPKGKRLVDKISLSEGFKERIQPKIVTLIACSNKKGEYLLYKRKKQPFFDKIGFPYGKIHMGERVDEAAHREFKEKTGIDAVLKHRGDVYITVHDEEDLITQMLCHVFSGNSNDLDMLTSSSSGESFWINPDKIKRNEEIPGFRQILTLIRKRTGFFFEEYFLDIHEL